MKTNYLKLVSLTGLLLAIGSIRYSFKIGIFILLFLFSTIGLFINGLILYQMVRNKLHNPHKTIKNIINDLTYQEGVFFVASNIIVVVFLYFNPDYKLFIPVFSGIFVCGYILFDVFG